MILIHNKDFINLNKQTEEVLANQGFSTTPGSVAKLFTNIINKNISDFYETLTINHVQSFITTATGDYLNAFGTLLNCERRDEEEDDNYRKRITNQTLSLAKANETSIRLAVLAIDGVDDVVLKRYSHGPGSMSIIPVCRKTTENLLGSVEEAVYNTISCGEKVIVKPPTLKYVKMTVGLTFSVDTDDVLKQSISIAVRQAIVSYINSLKVGHPLIINEITQRIMEVDERIITYGCESFKINNNNCLYINQGCRWDEKFAISPDANSIIVI